MKCETCTYYKPLPIVKMSGECHDPSKIIFVSDTAQNERTSVFEFSRCANHKRDQQA